MTAKELLKPRYIVIANYPLQNKEIGEIFETGKNGINYIIDTDKYDVREYPHLFRELDWWEYRNKEDMPTKLKSMASKNKADFDIEKEDIFHITDWDMNGMDGYVGKDRRVVCCLEMWSKGYGYIPVD